MQGTRNENISDLKPEKKDEFISFQVDGGETTYRARPELKSYSPSSFFCPHTLGISGSYISSKFLCEKKNGSTQNSNYSGGTFNS